MEYKLLSEKAAYLSGLVKGKGVDDEITGLIIDLLGEMASEIDRLAASEGELEGRIDDLDMDMSSILDEVYGEAEDEDEDEDGEELYEVVCPNCKETLYITDEDIDGGITSCPLCGESLELLFEDEDSGEE